MQSIVLTQPGHFEIVDIPLPHPPGVDEVQVSIRHVGICGTDLHAFTGHQPFFTYPRILGHELAVEVVDTGSSQTSLKTGDLCCVRPYISCGKCSACRRGFENACTRIQTLGVHLNGGMQEFINVPLNSLIRASLPAEQLAMVEMLAIGAHAVRRAQIIPGEVALVIGMGPIGLGVSQFAYQEGARVVGMDVSDSRLAFARKQSGIEVCIDAKQDFTEQLNSILGDELPTVVFDATGNAGSMMKSFQYVAHGGRLVFVGLFQGDVTFHDPDFHRREMSLLASRNATVQDFNSVLHRLKSGSIDIASWITHRASPAQMVQEFPAWVEPSSGVIKALLSF